MANFLEKLKKGMAIENMPEPEIENPAEGGTEETSEAEFAVSDPAEGGTIEVEQAAAKKIPSVEDLTKEELTMPSDPAEGGTEEVKKNKKESKNSAKAESAKKKTKKSSAPRKKTKTEKPTLTETKDKVKKIKVVKEKKSPAGETIEQKWPEGPIGELVIDLYETNGDVVIQSAIAGVNPDDLDISIDNDMVKIKGHRQKVYEEKDTNYFYQECHWGGFSREIVLPVEVDARGANAKIKNGVLTITIPKIDKIDKKKLIVEEEE